MVPLAADSLGRVLERIEKAAQRSGRSSRDITLVAVTKTKSLDQVLPFIEAGVNHIGENRVQEALSKYQNPDGLKKIPASFHLIGPLQSNKAKKAAGFFDMVQTIDREDIAEDLDRHAQALGRTLPCLIEVKISPESTKHGAAPETVMDLVAKVKSLAALRIHGLMGIAPLASSSEEARPFFAKLRQLFEKTGLKTLSMGMSSDFEVAIEEGATMVRIGTALFGSRP